MPEPTGSPKSLPLPLLALGAILILITAALAVRLIWEMTILTWQQGPQMVGFSLAHGYYAPLLLSPFFLALWTLISTILVLFWKLRHHTIARTTWAFLTAGLLILGALAIPQSFYNRIFIAKLAASPTAGTFLSYAAAEGDLSTVRALLARGVNIESADRGHITALHAAANAGQPKVAAYLLDHGADPNSLDDIGDSPLHGAIEDHHPDVANLLRARGAKDISPEQKKTELEIEDETLFKAEHAHPQSKGQANHAPPITKHSRPNLSPGP